MATGCDEPSNSSTSQSRPRVGIIVGMHNYEGILHQCIDSVIAQSYDSWECILIDNGSTDETIATAQRLTAHDSRFRLIRCDNRGPSFGRNVGFSALAPNHEYVVFLDGDDLLHPRFLQKLVSYLDANAAVGAVGCHYVEIDPHGNSVAQRIRSRWAPGWLGMPARIPFTQPATPFEAFFCVTGNGPFFMFRRSVLPSTAPYDETLWFCEDSDLLCKVALVSTIHFVPEFLYKKRTHPGNLSRNPRIGGEERFRVKWDNASRHAPELRARLESAVRYYYRRHVPLRDIKVAMKSVSGFIRTAEIPRLVFAAQLLANAVRGVAGLTVPRTPPVSQLTGQPRQ